MIRFLIHRPISVIMACIAILVLGIAAGSIIPVSLMPDIDIPRITVIVNSKNTSAREIENTIIGPLRRQLIQVAHLGNIGSETRDEKSVISLSFNYGTNIDLAFIEVNEKIDQIMSIFPKEVDRPKVIKASATDIPVYYLNLTLKNEFKKNDFSSETTLYPVSQKFIELSSLANQVIRKRLEQLPEVSMADISGLISTEVLVMPNMEKLESLNISLSQLEEKIIANNINLGNLLIRDGQYQYNLHFNSSLRNRKDIENLHIKIGDRLLQIKDVAVIIEHPQKRKGLVKFNGKDALTIAIIKQSDARMGELRSRIEQLITQFTKDYPDVKFDITRDQTQLLKYSISNLNQNLIFGALLAFIVMTLFLRDFKSPMLIGISMPASVVISLILFYIMGISINVLSLSGLVLGLGMMIDNSIIVIDNIMQYQTRGTSLIQSCIDATGEVFRPMLSSMLTSCAVFIPLIFLSGISGAIFYDQAIAVVIGHFASLVVSVTIIPVYYYYIYRGVSKLTWALPKIKRDKYEVLYEKSFRFVLKNQSFVWIIVCLMLVSGIFLYWDLPKSKLPNLSKSEILVYLDWNEKINIEENNLRVQSALNSLSEYSLQNTCLIGRQQFLFSHKSDLGASETIIHISANSPEKLISAQNKITEVISHDYPQAKLNFKEADNIFNLIFPEEESSLIACLRPTRSLDYQQNDVLKYTFDRIQKIVPENKLDKIPLQESLVLKIDHTKMISFGISSESLYTKVKTAFSENEILFIKNNQDFIPVVLGGHPRLMDEVLSQLDVSNNEGQTYPVRDLISEFTDYDLQSIIAGEEGEYYPIDLKVKNEDEAKEAMERIRNSFKSNFYEIDFKGSLFSNEALIIELTVILCISLVLLYLILVSQFESLSLPLIILLELPIDIFGAFIFLKLFGSGINLMSLIGLIVMSGIIINDSILKIDTTNQLVNQGYSLIRALLIAGQRRFKSIIMTCLVTVLAMVPLFFSTGLGAELQKPLALSITGGMLVGTLISLYVIPLCYYYLKRNSLLKV